MCVCVLSGSETADLGVMSGRVSYRKEGSFVVEDAYSRQFDHK